jgi:hypothetical protein
MEVPKPTCTWCGSPAVPPYGVVFMRQHFCCRACREKHRFAEEARETGHRDGEWMQNLRGPNASK